MTMTLEQLMALKGMGRAAILLVVEVAADIAGKKK